MRKFLTILMLTFVVSAATALAQAPSYLSGEVIAVDAAAKRMTLKTKDGETIVGFDENSAFKRVSAEKPDFKTAQSSSAAEIKQGDKLVAVVELDADKKTVKKTRTVYLMTKDDIAKRQETEQTRWTTRGVSGRVTAVNAAANEITVQLRGDQTVVVAANDKTGFRRYAPNSARYADAAASKLSDIKIGDQLRATGEKSADGARLQAEEVLSGSFRMVVGKIQTIDQTKREISIKEAQTDKLVTVAVGDNTLLRRFPAETAQRMAQIQTRRTSGAAANSPQSGTNQRPNRAGSGRPPESAGQNAGAPTQNGGQNDGTRGDLDQMLESMPVLNLSELKAGDAVAASGSGDQTAARVTALKFVAGIEPFLIVPPAAAQPNGRPAAAPQITIPGLDGGGTP